MSFFFFYIFLMHILLASPFRSLESINLWVPSWREESCPRKGLKWPLTKTNRPWPRSSRGLLPDWKSLGVLESGSKGPNLSRLTLKTQGRVFITRQESKHKFFWRRANTDDTPVKQLRVLPATTASSYSVLGSP